ncbi:hypothetical protein [Nitrososphaera sp.]|uniref:hypothetical protein n=1 Tax=Nitrososphaera sp. TaxID=1971748 RepID=UPI00307EB630
MELECPRCGAHFETAEELAAHRQDEEEGGGEGVENLMLKRAGDEEKARRRTRGPYRKSSPSATA